MKLLRAINEFINRSQKCNRVGHKIKVEQVDIRCYSSDIGKVAADFHCKIDYCSRCGIRLSDPYDKDEFDYWTGISQPSSDARKMKEQGFLIIND